MPDIPNFTIPKQDGSLSCWVAAARSVLDFYAGERGDTGDSATQKELVSLFSKGGQLSGDSERILLAAGALRNSEKFNGDEAAVGQAPRLWLRIKDSVTRREPVVVNLRQGGGHSVGHALVLFGWNGDEVHMADPSLPHRTVVAKLTDILLSFRPYGDMVQYSSINCYTEKLIFTQCPPAWRARRVEMPNVYSPLFKA